MMFGWIIHNVLDLTVHCIMSLLSTLVPQRRQKREMRWFKGQIERVTV